MVVPNPALQPEGLLPLQTTNGARYGFDIETLVIICREATAVPETDDPVAPLPTLFGVEPRKMPKNVGKLRWATTFTPSGWGLINEGFTPALIVVSVLPDMK